MRMCRWVCVRVCTVTTVVIGKMSRRNGVRVRTYLWDVIPLFIRYRWWTVTNGGTWDIRTRAVATLLSAMAVTGAVHKIITYRVHGYYILRVGIATDEFLICIKRVPVLQRVDDCGLWTKHFISYFYTHVQGRQKGGTKRSRTPEPVASSFYTKLYYNLIRPIV